MGFRNSVIIHIEKTLIDLASSLWIEGYTLAKMERTDWEGTARSKE